MAEPDTSARGGARCVSRHSLARTRSSAASTAAWSAAAGRSRASLTLRLPVEYVVFPDEGHGWCKIANRSTSTVALTLSFVKYLKGSPMVTVDGGDKLTG